MKKSEIFIQTLAEVSGRPKNELEDMLAAIRRANPGGGWDQEVPESEAKKLLASFRKEATGIIAWLVQGAAEVSRHNGNA